MGGSLSATMRGVTLPPSMAVIKRFQDENVLVRSFSVAKNRNQIQTSLDRKTNAVEGLWEVASGLEWDFGWSQES